MSLQQGAERRDSVKVTYLNLHSGQLSRTFSEKYVKANKLEEQVKDWRKYTTKNKAEEVFTYYALDFPRVTGYVTRIKYFSKPLGDTTKTGYHIFIDCGNDGIFCIEISPNDRMAYRSFMSIAMNVDFTQLCQFGAFTNDKDRLVFVIWQETENGEVVSVKPKYREIWMNADVASQVKKADFKPTETEEKQLKRKEDGTIDLSYPYVRERKNPTTQKLEWNFDKWQEFLNENFDDVLKRSEEAHAEREGNKADTSFDTDSFEAEGLPEFTGGEEPAPAIDDDDIPF